VRADALVNQDGSNCHVIADEGFFGRNSASEIEESLAKEYAENRVSSSYWQMEFQPKACQPVRRSPEKAKVATTIISRGIRRCSRSRNPEATNGEFAQCQIKHKSVANRISMEHLTTKQWRLKWNQQLTVTFTEH
jgi:hypothetical protein